MCTCQSTYTKVIKVPWQLTHTHTLSHQGESLLCNGIYPLTCERRGIYSRYMKYALLVKALNPFFNVETVSNANVFIWPNGIIGMHSLSSPLMIRTLALQAQINGPSSVQHLCRVLDFRAKIIRPLPWWFIENWSSPINVTKSFKVEAQNHIHYPL